jgi:hypothetical protein
MLALRLDRYLQPLALAVVLLACHAAHAGADAVSSWKALEGALGAERSAGIHEAEEWIFSCHREPIDPNSVGFEGVELASCKEEAMLQLVRHCTGAGSIGDGLASPLPSLLEDAYLSWYSGRIRTVGTTWVESRRTGGHDIAVLALPRDACATMPKRSAWRKSAREVADSSQSWIVSAALAEGADPAVRKELLELAALRIDESVKPIAPAWPEALVKLPDLIASDKLASLGVGDLARLAAMRPGDRAIWGALAQRCRDLGLTKTATLIDATPTRLGWPSPAPIADAHVWSSVPTDGLPAALAAVIRHAGAIPAKGTTGSAAEKSATKAYSAMTPDLAEAEARAREACSMPNANALSLLAAIRLSRADATTTDLLQALAFAHQAAALDGQHPFAAVNMARALKRLGWREHAKAALAALPPSPEGSWQQREATLIAEWLQEN